MPAPIRGHVLPRRVPGEILPSAELMRILVVEDERKVASFLRQGLEEEGHAVEVAGDGAAALDLMQGDQAYDLVVLDVMLPKRDGFEVLKALRRRRSGRPSSCSPRGMAWPTRSRASTGAPTTTSPSPLPSRSSSRGSARSCAGEPPRARRRSSSSTSLSIPPPERSRGAGRRITLTAREYALLEYFLRNVGRVLTRPMIAQHVWGLDFDPESNIVDVYVGYLRRKIDGEGDRRLLHTLRGAGYKLAAEE